MEVKRLSPIEFVDAVNAVRVPLVKRYEQMGGSQRLYTDPRDEDLAARVAIFLMPHMAGVIAVDTPEALHSVQPAAENQKG